MCYIKNTLKTLLQTVVLVTTLYNYSFSSDLGETSSDLRETSSDVANTPSNFRNTTNYLLYSSGCTFPKIFIKHNGTHIPTDIDGGPNTWFNPMIGGQYDGCGLGIPDTSNFNVRAGHTHSTHGFKYYAVIGNSSHTCANRGVYGNNHPITTRYNDICHNSGGVAPGICLVYQSQFFSSDFLGCMTQMNRQSKLLNISKEYPTTNSLMDLDACMGSYAAGLADYKTGTKACFPYPLPPSPPPFCPNQLTTSTQTPLFLPICNRDDSTNTEICGEPITTSYSTHSKPCARVTFENHIRENTSMSYSSRLLPLCSKENTPNCVNVPQNEIKKININAMAAINNTGYLEAIYTKTSNNIQTQTRWTTAPQTSPLQFYGYNLAEFQDLCFDFTKQNGSSQSTITDNYGSTKTFRTCTSASNAGSFCIEEQTGGANGNECVTTSPYCFSRPNIDKPSVTFCQSNNMINTPNNYCMQVASSGQTFTFNKNQKTQGSFRGIETNNNYDTPTTSGTCTAYYDENNNQYIKNGSSPCQYYGGLYYNGSNYVSGANKFCLVGYSSDKNTDMVCNNATLNLDNTPSTKISDRFIPPNTTASPLGSGDCCKSSSQDTSNPCQPGDNKQLRVKNPIEEGICVDIMPFELQTCTQFQASSNQNSQGAVTTQAAAQIRNQCSAYQSFCTQRNSANNGYVNADICNKNYIDCLSGSIPGTSVSGVSSSNICSFYRLS